MRIDRVVSSTRSDWAWALLTLLALPIAFLGAFVVAIAVVSRSLVPNVAEGLRLDLALWLLCFGALGMLGVIVAARLAYRRWLPVRAEHVAVAVLGIVLAIAVELTLHEWAEASLGYYDWDFIGWTAGLSFSLVVLAIAVFGRAIAPAGSGAPARVGTRLGVVLVLFIILSNMPALGDGIGPNSWPLAISIGLAGVYAIAAAAAAIGWSSRPSR